MAVLPAAIAAELTSGEEQVMFSKEVLQETLNNIKTNLDAGFPVTTELIFLEDVRNELKRQLADIEAEAAAMPYIPGAELNPDFEEGLNNARKMVDNLGEIIINPSIEKIDSVLELMETLDQEVQGEILADQPDFLELPNRVINKTTAVFETPPLDYVGAAVTDADLAETDEIVFTDRLMKKVEELHKNFVHLVSWVTLNVRNEFYPGSTKTTDEVLVDMAGNA